MCMCWWEIASFLKAVRWQRQRDWGRPILISPLIFPVSLSLTLSAFSGTIVRQWWSMPLWPSVLACLKSVEKRQDNTQAWLYVCVNACVISTLTEMSASILCRQGWSPRSLQGSYRAVSDVGESETFKWLTAAILYWISPVSPHLTSLPINKKQTKKQGPPTYVFTWVDVSLWIKCIRCRVFSVYSVIPCTARMCFLEFYSYTLINGEYATNWLVTGW